MKAIQINQYGDNSVLNYVETEIPQPLPHQVLVKVKAAAVNPVDYKIRSGYMQQQLPKTFPFTLGWEGAGEIISLGSEVKRFNMQDEVLFMPNFMQGGTYAEYVAVNENELVKKPKNINFNTAATIPVAWSTAWTALMKEANIQKGQRILILGAGGSVGQMAVQLARMKGTYVAGTATGKNLTEIKQLGIDRAIDYTSTDIVSLNKTFDVVLDLAGGDLMAKSYPLVRDGGWLLSTTQFPDAQLLETNKINGKMVFTALDTAAFQQLFAWLDSQEIRLKMPDVYPLEKAAEALGLVEKRKAKNKMVLEM